MKSILVWVIAAAAVLYAAYAVAMILLHPRFIYPFSQAEFSYPDYERVLVAVPDADPLELRVAKGKTGAPVILYFMGNVGALEIFSAMLEHHRLVGRSVVAMAYRGGGAVPGAPSEKQLKRDAEAAMDFAVELSQEVGGPLIVQGYSLGTGLAQHVVERKANAEGMILVSPYARMCELMAQASNLPACWLPGIQAWRTIDDIGMIKAPVKIIHGTADTLIPPDHSARLLAEYERQGKPASRELIDGAGHSNLMQWPEYLRAIDAFIAEVSKP